MRVNKLLSLIEDNQGVIIKGKANIFYYSGFTSEDAVLLLTKIRRILVTDSRYTYQAKKEAVGFEIYHQGLADIAKSLKCEELLFEENKVTVAEFAVFQKLGKKLSPAEKVISRPRRTKDASEIESMLMNDLHLQDR